MFLDGRRYGQSLGEDKTNLLAAYLLPIVCLALSLYVELLVV